MYKTDSIVTDIGTNVLWGVQRRRRVTHSTQSASARPPVPEGPQQQCKHVHLVHPGITSAPDDGPIDDVHDGPGGHDEGVEELVVAADAPPRVGALRHEDGHAEQLQQDADEVEPGVQGRNRWRMMRTKKRTRGKLYVGERCDVVSWSARYEVAKDVDNDEVYDSSVPQTNLISSGVSTSKNTGR